MCSKTAVSAVNFVALLYSMKLPRKPIRLMELRRIVATLVVGKNIDMRGLKQRHEQPNKEGEARLRLSRVIPVRRANEFKRSQRQVLKGGRAAFYVGSKEQFLMFCAVYVGWRYQ